jgi:hydrogenase maturation protease
MSTRVLCLGNTLLADDAFGIVIAEHLRRTRPDIEVCESSTSGFDLLDYTLGASRLLVVDTGSRRISSLCRIVRSTEARQSARPRRAGQCHDHRG